MDPSQKVRSDRLAEGEVAMASSSDGQAYLERQSEDTLQEEADAERSPLLGGRPDEDKPVEEDEDDLTEDLDGAGKTELVQAIW